MEQTRSNLSATLYPKTTADNYDYRARILDKCLTSETFRAAVYEKCRTDIIFWINSFCWVYEPRPERIKTLGYRDAHLLFLTWEFQDKYIKWLIERIENGEDCLTEKSRDMGVSWLTVTVFTWFWMFGGAGNDFLVGSRKSDFVDKQGEMDALMPKIRYQVSRQPRFLKPRGFVMREHGLYMRLINPETGSTISGESNNEYFGTGGRKKAVLFDEFSKWKYTDESAWQSASDVTDCKIAVSSANGKSNHFYDLRSGKAGDIKVYRLHWTEHPHKTPDWYENEKKRRSKKDVAAELDIDYSASVTNKAWENYKYETHVTTEELYNSELPIVLSCDFNISPMSWIVIHEHSGRTLIFDELVDTYRTRTEDHAREFCSRFKDHKNKTVYLYGDATGKHGSTQSTMSNYAIIKTVLGSEGWRVLDRVPRSNPPVADRLNASNKRLSDYERDGESFVLISSRAENLINSIEMTRRKGDGIDKSDDIDHPAEAWSYYEAERYPVRPRKSKKTKLRGL